MRGGVEREVEAERAILEARKLAALAKICAQVSHDIRSPLAALEVVLQELAAMPEDLRLLIRSSVGRIRDIANQLFTENDAMARGANKSEGLASHLLATLVDEIVTDSRMQYRHLLAVNIEARLSESSYGIFSALAASDLKRCINNCINNAVESLIDERGEVVVQLRAAQDQAVLEVLDNGRGIPDHVLPKLCQLGATFGKENGQGLGLYYARELAEAHGGKLEIDSAPGGGTRLRFVLPTCEAPAWFVHQIGVHRNTTFVVLDDDQAIHQIWQRRVDRLPHAHRPSIIHLSVGEELRTLVEKRDGKRYFFLMDFELLKQKQTGLDWIETLGIQQQGILVTSHFSNPDIQTRCARAHVKILPKGMAAIVPLVEVPS